MNTIGLITAIVHTKKVALIVSKKKFKTNFIANNRMF